MAQAKSIIDIDVRDEAFREFSALFEKYQAQLAKLPGAWGKVGAAAAKSAKQVKVQGDAANSMAESASKAADAQKRFTTFSGSAAKAMGSVAKTTASIAKNIFSATGQLLRWAGIGSVFAGLVGGGGLLGASALAGTAGNLRRQAKGAGISTAELQAASASFNKYVDAEAQLQRISEVRADVSKRGALAAAGLGRLGGLSNADFQAEALKIARQTFIKAGATRQGAEAHGLLELFSFEELTRLKNTREDEIEANISEYRTRKRLLEVGDTQLKSWQDLSIQLDVAGRTIGNVLIDKLSPLAAPLTRLSESFAEALGGILGDDRMAGWINSLGDSIVSFSKYLKSDEFTSATKSFAEGAKEMGTAMLKLARFINDPAGALFGTSEPKNTSVPITWATAKNAAKTQAEAPKAAAKSPPALPPLSGGGAEGGYIVPAIQPPLSGLSQSAKGAVAGAVSPLKGTEKRGAEGAQQSQKAGSAGGVAKVLSQSHTTITVNNATGGNAIVSMAAAAK